MLETFLQEPASTQRRQPSRQENQVDETSDAPQVIRIAASPLVLLS
jgi:hypothetical protein